MTQLNRLLFNLYRVKKGLLQAARKLTAGITYGKAAKYSRTASFINYFIAWNLVGGAILFGVFGAKDEATGELKIKSYEDLKQKLVEDEAKAQRDYEEKKLKRSAQLASSDMANR